MVALACNPSTYKVEARGFKSEARQATELRPGLAMVKVITDTAKYPLFAVEETNF